MSAPGVSTRPPWARLTLVTEIEQSFRDIEQFATAYDPISLLSQLTLTFLFVPEDQFQPESSDVFQWQRRIEFLASFLLVRNYPFDQKASVDGAVIEKVEKLLQSYFAAIDRQMLTEITESRSPERDMLLSHAKIHSLYVRGDAYPHQLFTFAQDLYGPHDAWFRQHLGFTIAEAITLSKAIELEYSDRSNRRRREVKSEAQKKVDELILANEATENDRANWELQIGCGLYFGSAENILAFTPEELSQSSGVSLGIAVAFLDRMSQRFGYHNPQFPSSFTDPTVAPWDYSTLNERPLVTRDGRYWLFVPPLLAFSLYSTFYFDLLDDRLYRPCFEAARGKFLEEKTAECLQRVFPPNSILLNPFYPDGNEMADVMVLHDRKILIFQCKSKILTYRSRIGADFEVLREDLRKAIAEAFRQGTRAQNYLRTSERAEVRIHTGPLAIDMTQVTGIYLVSLTSMPLQDLAGRLANTNSILGLFPENEYPWSVSLGDLDVITQVINSPARFLHYVLQRQAVERTSFGVHADEMDYLGFYLSHGMRFDLDDFRGFDQVALSGFSDEVDRWVFDKFERKQNVSAPQGTPVDGFDELLSDVEKSGDAYATDCAIALLDLTSAGRKSVVQLARQTKERSRRDRGLHSFSTVLKTGTRGFSYVAFDAHGDKIRLYRQAASFAMLKKYRSKCTEWVGLGSDLASDRAVDVAFFISHPWSYDDQIEKLADSTLREGRQVDLSADATFEGTNQSL